MISTRFKIRVTRAKVSWSSVSRAADGSPIVITQFSQSAALFLKDLSPTLKITYGNRERCKSFARERVSSEDLAFTKKRVANVKVVEKGKAQRNSKCQRAECILHLSVFVVLL
ncbi:hypothetical protein TNCV_4132581 [Trichonephila clavipes]|nr:hypothetical protein TNCV_4132581 [Trichonephila clavipes]